MGKAKATHCKVGHELSADNIYTDRRGFRQCKTCAKDRKRRQSLVIRKPSEIEAKRQGRAMMSFSGKIDKTPGFGPLKDCHKWTGTLDKNGYGMLYTGKDTVTGKPTRVKAHRFVYQQRHGEIPAGLVIMHSCDNPSCVNIDHLSAGTPAENIADMFAKGRNPSRSGLRAPRSHCKKGHLLNVENRIKKGSRICQICYDAELARNRVPKNK